MTPATTMLLWIGSRRKLRSFGQVRLSPARVSFFGLERHDTGFRHGAELVQRWLYQ
jgi:hypothetical protein